MNVLYVLQGVPGSGKSTVAKHLQAATGAVICSTDDYFTGADGVYRFDPTKLGEAHQANQEKASRLLREGKSVIVDNTNILRKHCKPYVAEACACGASVVFVRCEGRFGSIHSVPPETVERMRNQMETLTLISVMETQ